MESLRLVVRSLLVRMLEEAREAEGTPTTVEITEAQGANPELLDRLSSALPAGRYRVYALGRWNSEKQTIEDKDSRFSLVVDNIRGDLAFDDYFVETMAMSGGMPKNSRLKEAIKDHLLMTRLVEFPPSSYTVTIVIAMSGARLNATWLEAKRAYGMNPDGGGSETKAPEVDLIAAIPGMKSGMETPRQRKNGTKVYLHEPTGILYGTFAYPPERGTPGIFKYVRELRGQSLRANPDLRSTYLINGQDYNMGDNLSMEQAAERIRRRVETLMNR